MLSWRLLVVAVALVSAVGITEATSSQAVPLTKDENAQVLAAALADPVQSFFHWAVRHKKHYVSGAPPALLATARASNSLLARLLPTSNPSKTAVANTVLTKTYAARQLAWLDNARFAYQYNQRNSGHWLGLNSLADLTFDEYRMLLGTRLAPDSPATRLMSSRNRGAAAAALQEEEEVPRNEAHIPGFMYEGVDITSLPKSVDWRNQSAVTVVKNQMMCGSCWAFATTGAIEGINAIRTKKLVSLSEQELVDCDRDVDQGCSGGMMDNAYVWIVQNHGLDTEEDWPYTGAEEPMGCDERKKLRNRVVTIDGYQNIPVGDEASLLRAAAHQPVAVAVEADSRPFQLYMGGVMSDPGCGSQLNHGVLVVGYGGLDSGGFPSSQPADPANGPYWIVKNSWGAGWGLEGYIQLQMGFKDNQTGLAGICGITLAASYPVKNGPNPPEPKPDPKPDPKPTPKPPGPVMCDTGHACPPQSTCCCLDDKTGQADNKLCALWGCCPIEGATCCADHLHCCPQELPVCDTEQGRCMPQAGSQFSISWLRNQPAIRIDRDKQTS